MVTSGGKAAEIVSYRSAALGRDNDKLEGNVSYLFILMGESLTCVKDDGGYLLERKSLTRQEIEMEKIIVNCIVMQNS